MGFACKKDGYAFFGAILLNMLLGTLYCWSCYLVPLEQALGVGRGVLSSVFSLATICFTAAVAKIGPSCYSRLNPAVIGTGAALLGGAGMIVASQAIAYVSVVPLFVVGRCPLTPPDPYLKMKGAWYPGGFNPCTYQVNNRFQSFAFQMQLARYVVGYALLFGVASGVGYGLSVQISAMAPFGGRVVALTPGGVHSIRYMDMDRTGCHQLNRVLAARVVCSLPGGVRLTLHGPGPYWLSN
jgi:hypothetical protein